MVCGSCRQRCGCCWSEDRIGWDGMEEMEGCNKVARRGWSATAEGAMGEEHRDRMR